MPMTLPFVRVNSPTETDCVIVYLGLVALQSLQAVETQLKIMYIMYVHDTYIYII